MWSVALTSRPFSAAAVGLGLITVLVSWASEGSRTYVGEAKVIGDGALQAYVTLEANSTPRAVGVLLTDGALQRLPLRKNHHSRCYDLNGNGQHSAAECLGDDERILELPADVVSRARLPFKWISVNWNAEGHHPPPPKPGEAPAAPVYAHPHFDFHFYAWDRERVDAIAPGRCGEFVDCGDFERGRTPLAPEYIPAGHVDVGIVVPRMGNHLLDSRSPELANSATRFTRTFIYGAFDGELIFWEPMITLDFLRRAADTCFEISQPAAFRRAGHYPTRYCVRRHEGKQQRTVSLEGFVYHRAG